MPSNGDRRLALSCDAGGRVGALLRDDHGLMGEACVGQPLPTLVAPASTRKCFEMLDELRRESIVFGWALDLESEGRTLTLHFAGALRDGECLLVACDQVDDIAHFNEELARLNNEQVNQLRSLLKERTRARPGPEGELLSEFAALDNEGHGLRRELAQRSARLAHLSHEKSLLLGMVAHDLRNPLMVIQAYAERLLAEMEGEPRTFAEEIERSCQRMVEIIDGSLDQAAIAAAAPQLHLEELSPRAWLADALRPHRLSARAASVELATVVGEPPERIRTDPTKLRQVLDNLVLNALRVAPKGSRLEVRLEGTPQGLALEVQDQGPGVPEELQQLIFEPFATQGPRPRGVRAVHGLGLAIVRRLVEILGGRIELRSAPHEGACFRVRLPLEPPEPRPQSGAARS